MKKQAIKRIDSKVLTVMAAVLLFGVDISLGVTIAGPWINPANGHFYYLLDADTWTNSEDQAIALGGHLVTINDQAEQDLVFETFSGGRNLWIGFTDTLEEGNFVWISGEAVTYTNWETNEPNNLQDEDYAHINGQNADWNGQWNDLHDWGREGWTVPYGVVEVIPEPATLGLLLVGGMVLLRRRY